MRKILKELSMILFVIVIASGCSSDKKEAVNKKTDKEDKVDASTVSEDSSKTEKSDELVMLSDCSNTSEYNTNEGRYYISLDNNMIDENESIPSIMYVDYATKKEVFLCNKPNCKHNDDTCDAVLPDEIMMGQYSLFGDGKSLYLVSTPADSDGSISTCEVAEGYGSMLQTTSDFAPQIMTLNLDGTDRETIYTFDSGVVLEDVFMLQGDCLYMVQKKLSDEKIDSKTTVTSSFDRKLVSLNLESKKLDVVMDLEGDQDIIGCYGNKVVTSELVFDHELTTDEIYNDDVYFSELKKAKYIIRTIDIKTKEQGQIKEFLGKDEFNVIVSGQYMFYSIESDNTVNRIDLSDLSEKVINDKNAYRIMKVYDNFVICNEFTESESFSGYIINTDTNETIKMPDIKTKKMPIDIVASTDDSFFVIYDFKEEDEYVAWVGVTQKVITSKSFGLIKKENLLKGEDEYSDVDMIRMGD